MEPMPAHHERSYAAMRKAALRGSVGFDYLLEEYRSLREESAHSRQSQQSTLSWSLAAFATVFAGGLVFLGDEFKTGSLGPLAFGVLALIFGIALPGFAVGSCATYLGEIHRMERASSYLRNLEIQIGSYPLVPRRPLRWETFLTYGDKNRGGRKFRIVYLGGFALYGLCLVVSSLVLVTGAYNSDVGRSDPWVVPAVWVWAIVVVAFYVVFVLVKSIQIQRLERDPIDYASIRPR